MRPASIPRMVASQHQPFGPLRKPRGRHEGSSRTTTCCRRHTRCLCCFAFLFWFAGSRFFFVCVFVRSAGFVGGWLCCVFGLLQRHKRSISNIVVWCLIFFYCLLLLRQEGKTNLSHDGLNPAHVPCWWVNNPTLPLGCGWEARKSRHRRIKKRRRFERLAATSQLSLW